jgi:hypothetical protein
VPVRARGGTLTDDRPAARTRFRCARCGNLTRFDVVETRRTKAFYHFTVGGELSVEDEEVLSSHREQVTCRWCGASDGIEEVPLEEEA